MIERWVNFWNHREPPTVMALLRICLALVFLWELFELWHLGLVEPLYAPRAGGGIGDPVGRHDWLYQQLPNHAMTAWILFVPLVLLTIMFGVGFLTRFSAVALVILYAEMNDAIPVADRSVDALLRNMTLLLAFSQCHRCWSVDAKIRTGSWHGDGKEYPNWCRYLVILQLITLYFIAGISKMSYTWLPTGNWSALYLSMRDPAYALLPPSLLKSLYPMTQVLTEVTLFWEWGSPLLLLALYFRNTPTKAGRLRAIFNRINFVWIYLGIGIAFHFGCMVALNLGIFPHVTLCLYVAFLRPAELQQLSRFLTRWVSQKQRPVVSQQG